MCNRSVLYDTITYMFKDIKNRSGVSVGCVLRRKAITQLIYTQTAKHNIYSFPDHQSAVASLGLACNTKGALSSLFYLAYTFHNDVTRGILTNTNCEGDFLNDYCFHVMSLVSKVLTHTDRCHLSFSLL